MKKVRIFSDYCDSTGAKGAFKSWGFGSTVYKDMEIVDDETYTHAVILNHGNFPTLKVSKENVIGFHQEVYQLIDMRKHIDWIYKNCKKYFVYDRDYMAYEFTPEWYTFLPNLPLLVNKTAYIQPKSFRMSIIASDKGFLPGHIMRHEIIRRILKTDLDIHIYGRGCHLYRDSLGRIKGPVDDKRVVFAPYDFSIVIENMKRRFWITEKFVDPIICGCTPVYWGATEVSSVFGGDSHVPAPVQPGEFFELIVDVYKNPEKYIKDTRPALDRLYGDVNFAEFVWKQFSE
jgi:hypothetical protein